MSQPFLTMKLPLWASVFIDERHSFCELSGREEVQRGLYRRKIVAKPTYYLRLACACWHCNHYFRGYLFLFGNVCVTLTKKWNNQLVLGYWLLKKNYNGFTYHNTPRDNNKKKNCCCYNANYTASGYINGCNIIMLNPLFTKKTPSHFARNFRDLIVSLSQLWELGGWVKHKRN